MDKFNRQYELAIKASDGGDIPVRPPFTLEFDIHRNVFSSANVASFRIYNLNPNTRARIYKDQYDFGVFRQIAFKAGYNPSSVFQIEPDQKNLSFAFVGNITQAWSVREGNNMVTQLECFDGGFAFVNAFTNNQFPKGTTPTTMMQAFFENLKEKGTEPGAIGDYTGQLSRGNSYSGSTIDILREISGGGFFIDNNKAHALKDDEALEGDIQVIDARSGLLGTPVREQTYLNFDMLFEPRLIIGQKVRLNSITGANFNSDYKVLSLKHTGTISGSVAGNAITSVGLSYSTRALKVVR